MGHIETCRDVETFVETFLNGKIYYLLSKYNVGEISYKTTHLTGDSIKFKIRYLGSSYPLLHS